MPTPDPSNRSDQAASSAGDEWYCRVSGEVMGPLSIDDLVHIWQQGGLTQGVDVRCGIEGAWLPSGQVADLLAREAEATGDGASTTANAAGDLIKKSRHARRTGRAAPQSVPVTEKLRHFVDRVWDYVCVTIGDLLDFVRSRLLKSKIVLAVLGVVLVACLVPYFPNPFEASADGYAHTYTDAYEAYQTIAQQVREMREREASDEEWRQFAEESNRIAADFVGQLEGIAGARNRAAQHLLWAGRDWIPRIVEDAREEPSESEQRLERHLEIAAALRRGERVFPRDAASTRSSSPEDRGPGWVTLGIIGVDVLVGGFLLYYWLGRRSR